MTAKNQSYGPQYYKRGNIEVWDFIRDQRLNYHLGNAIKYICRAGYKDDPVEDLKKAMKGAIWFDKSDIMTDYFHTAYYMNINIGRWDKPYKLIS